MAFIVAVSASIVGAFGPARAASRSSSRLS